MLTVKLNKDDELKEWEAITIRQSMGQLQHSVDITVTDIKNIGVDRYRKYGGVSLEVFFDGSNIFDGYVQKFKESATGTSHTMQVKAESTAIDLVQCGHVGKYFWKDCTAESVINDVLKPFDINISINELLLPIPKEGLRVAVDGSAYDIIKKIAEQNGHLIYTDNEGVINIGIKMPRQQYCILTTGDYTNIDIDRDFSNAYSKLIIKSQQKSFKKDFKGLQQKEFEATGNNLKRYRPKIVISDGEQREQQKLVEYAQRRLNGNITTISLTVHSLNDKNGNLWGIGQRLILKEPNLEIDSEFIISDLTFTVSRSGTSTRLELKVPETFKLFNPEG